MLWHFGQNPSNKLHYSSFAGKKKTVLTLKESLRLFLSVAARTDHLSGELLKITEKTKNKKIYMKFHIFSWAEQLSKWNQQEGFSDRTAEIKQNLFCFVAIAVILAHKARRLCWLFSAFIPLNLLNKMCPEPKIFQILHSLLFHYLFSLFFSLVMNLPNIILCGKVKTSFWKYL